MPNLFGLDIAALVNNAIESAGNVRPATLTQVTPGTRTSGDLTGGTNPTEQSYPCNAFVEDRNETRINGTLVSEGGRFVGILGGSLPPGIEPGSGDRVLIDGVTYEINEAASVDPAAALYTLRVES